MARPKIHDDTVRRRLLEAASEIIAQQGVDALSMRKAATTANTTTTAIYSLFGSREALIDAVVTEGFQRFAAHLRAVPHTDDPDADLLALGRSYRINALENPHFYRVMFNNTLGSSTPERSTETFDMLVDAVARAAQCSPPQAQGRAYRLWAYIHGLVSLELSGFTTPPNESDNREHAFLAALRASASLFRH